MASSTDQPAAGLGGVGGAGLDVLVGPASATYAVKLSHFEGASSGVKAAVGVG